MKNFYGLLENFEYADNARLRDFSLIGGRGTEASI